VEGVNELKSREPVRAKHTQEMIDGMYRRQGEMLIRLDRAEDAIDYAKFKVENIEAQVDLWKDEEQEQ